MDCHVCGNTVYEDDELCAQCMTPVQREPQVRSVVQTLDEPAPEPDAIEPDPRPRCGEHPEFPVIGTCARCGKFICVRCAPEAGAMEQPRCADCVKRPEAELDGIGGWLILLAIQLVLSTLGALGGGVALVLLKGDRQSMLIAAPMLALGVYQGFVAVMFFARKRITPVLLLIWFGFGAIGAAFSFEELNAQAIARFAVLTAWAFYVLTSSRVKRTFVK